MPDEANVILDKIKELGTQLDQTRGKILTEAGDKAKEVVDTAVADVRGDLLETETRIKNELVPALLERQRIELKAEADKANEEILAKMDDIATRAEMAASGGGVSKGRAEDTRILCDAFRDFAMYRSYETEPVKRAKELIERRDLSEGTDTEGGYLVPEPLREEMIKIITVIDPIESLARKITIRNGNSYKAPKRTGIPTAYKVGEQETPTASAPTFGSIDRVLHPVSVYTTGISTDFLADVVEADQVITEAAAEAFAYKLGYNYIMGTGVGEPEGIFVNADISTVTGTNTTSHKVSGEDFFKLLTTLKEFYRPNATFIFNSTVLYNALSLRENLTAAGGGTASGAFILPFSLRDGVPATIAGKPFRICESIASDGTINYLSVAFGDFRKGYWIARKGGISLLKDPYTGAPDWKYLWRMRDDGVVVNSEAIKILKMG